MFGAEVDEVTAARIVNCAREAGVNFIDTADVYSGGRSEEVTGRIIKGQRNAWVLGTKVGHGKGPNTNGRGLSRRNIMNAISGSLKRLGTEYIDVYYLHREDRSTPLQETILAIADLIRQGKILYFGICNHSSWQGAAICHLCDQVGIDRPIVSQINYNVVNRVAELEHIPACSHYGVGVVPFSPLARGILTGKYLPDSEPPPGTRAARGDRRILLSEWRRESLQVAQELKLKAESKGITAGQFSISWLLNNRAVSSAIAGPRTVEQWNDYVRALEYEFTADDEAFVNGLVATGHCSTPGFNDPEYPIRGRPTFTG